MVTGTRGNEVKKFKCRRSKLFCVKVLVKIKEPSVAPKHIAEIYFTTLSIFRFFLQSVCYVERDIFLFLSHL